MTQRVRLPELELRAADLGKVIGDQMPPGVGFCLVLFQFGPGGFLTYVSNGERADTINMLKELIVTLELHGDQPPGAPPPPATLG